MNPSVYLYLFLATFVCCLFMTGLIWFVQIVHYPLFAAVGADVIKEYAAVHANRTTFVVMAPMLIELGTAVLLVMMRPAEGTIGLSMTSLEGITSLALVGIIFCSTAFLQVPDHDTIQRTGSMAAVTHLVRSNWIRTIVWSARSVLLGNVLIRTLSYR